jgi:hypothetical protein
MFILYLLEESSRDYVNIILWELCHIIYLTVPNLLLNSEKNTSLFTVSIFVKHILQMENALSISFRCSPLLFFPSWRWKVMD